MSSQDERLTQPDPSPNKDRLSGWEIADSAAAGLEKVANGVGKVTEGVGFVMLKVYSVALAAVGVACFVYLPEAWWAALLFIAYGVYLLVPGGSKWVIW